MPKGLSDISGLRSIRNVHKSSFPQSAKPVHLELYLLSKERERLIRENDVLIKREEAIKKRLEEIRKRVKTLQREKPEPHHQSEDGKKWKTVTLNY